ncbi:MAG: MotA/TolQ/ExbB proton channel family protein [Proteobacteria bacterium]|nr:MotA/TolQ/ExbB proton channel family protein [Pseudomonadota bacterium]MDA1057765.1 MotA/TolQ/ExbB proton channel family protein [Pseudomonadota bacterium]
MNPSTTIGIFGGIAIVAIAVVFSVDQASLLWNPLGLLVVFGGTLAATLIAFPMNEVGRIFTVILIVLRNERLYAKDDQAELVSVARSVLRADIRAIETRLKSIKNPFLRLGIQLVIDNTALDDIVDIMTWRIEKLKAKEKAEALIFRAMASFAPAFGMIGTLLGLVNMLNALNADVAAIGSNMAIAMMTTLYGVIAGNLLFKPIAMKFEQRTQQRVALMMTVMQGVILLR